MEEQDNREIKLRWFQKNRHLRCGRENRKQPEQKILSSWMKECKRQKDNKQKCDRGKQ